VTKSAETRCLLTGGTGQLGRPLADALRRHGWAVHAAGSADGDVRTASACRALVAAAVEDMGGLDVVITGAGAGWRVQPLADVDEDLWDDAFDVTVKGTFFVAQAAMPHLRASAGLLVILGDVAADLAWTNLAAHSTAKAAQAHLVPLFARALAPDARACGVAPGPVAVPDEYAEGRAARTLLGRLGSPDDVVGAILYLHEASYVTGAILAVDGGRRLRTVYAEP
jgi:pteridine reductase